MKKILALSAAIAALPLALQTTVAQAGPLSWTELAVGYDVADAVDATVDALDVRGGIGLGQMFHVQASYLDGTADPDGGGPSFDFDGYEVRAGVHPSITEDTQAVVDVMYFDYSGDQNTSEDGWGIGFGVRHKISDQFEMRTQIDYYDGSFDAGGPSTDFNNTALTIGGRYYWTPSLFTGAEVIVGGAEAVSLADGGDTMRVNVGWSFGGDVL